MLLSYLKTPIMRTRVLFGLEDIFFVMSGGCPYFLSKALDKVYRLEKLEKVGQT